MKMALLCSVMSAGALAARAQGSDIVVTANPGEILTAAQCAALGRGKPLSSVPAPAPGDAFPLQQRRAKKLVECLESDTKRSGLDISFSGAGGI